MNPGEAERKLHKLEEEHEETLRELEVYRAFFKASYDMNVAAAGLPEAQLVRDATNACVAEQVRERVPKKSALEALREGVKRE
jgi:hypothetical protein